MKNTQVIRRNDKERSYDILVIQEKKIVHKSVVIE